MNMKIFRIGEIGVDVNAGILYVKGLDLVHDTPILDIKPYIPAFDSFPDARAGWLDEISNDKNLSRNVGYQSFNVHPREIHNKKSIEEYS